jgi:predicted TIM-barrel fold metal-dependent hydrolase
MRIDVHSHFMSEKAVRFLEKRSSFPFARFVSGTYQVHCCSGLVVPFGAPIGDMDRKIADMDTVGIDVAVLSLGIPGPELLGGSQADEMARVINDALAEMIAARPERFWGYATLGFGDLDASLDELDRCFGDLGFRGLQLFSNINGRPLDAPEFRPVFTRMAELGRPVFIHPTVPLNRNYLMDLVPAPVLAFVVDTTLAAMRLALAGVLSETGMPPIIIPHTGAAVPYLMGRLDGMLRHFAAADVVGEPSRLLRRLYMDTVAYSPEPLRWCFSAMGAGQLLLGTDHPYGPWQVPVRLLDELACSRGERRQMTEGNARRLFAAGADPGRPARAKV